MAFPSASGARQTTLASALLEIMTIASAVKSRASALSVQSAAQPVAGSSIIAAMRQFIESRARLLTLAAVPGLGAYAQEQLNDATINVANEFSALTAGLDQIRDWMETNFPKNAAGYLLREQFDSNGRVAERFFSPAELAQLRTRLDALSALVD